MRKTVIIVSSDSRESANKALQFAAVAEHYGYRIHILASKYVPELDCGYRFEVVDITKEYCVDKDQIACVIPCSDGVSSFSMRILGDSGANVKALHSKAESYRLLKASGFNTLDTEEIRSFKHLKHCQIRGPIFVKPDWSSGVSSQVPWGYKKFESIQHFVSYLKDNGLAARFDIEASNPYNRVIVMEHVPHDGMYCISAIIKEGKASCFGHSFVSVSGEDYFYDYVHYSDEYGTAALEPYINNMWDQGFHNSFCYIQCLMKDGVLYPIDVNTRLSTYLDTLATHCDQGFYYSVFKYMIGESDHVQLRLPAPHTMVARIRSNPHKRIKHITWNDVDGVKPLNFNNLSASRATYDKAYSWPTYLCVADTAASLMNKRAEFETGVTIDQSD